MIGAKLVIDLDTTTPALEKMGQAVSGGSLAAFMHTKANEILQQRATARFEVEGDDASGQWAELRPLTNYQRELEGYSPVSPINARGGELRDFVVNSKGTVSSTGVSATNKWPGPIPQRDQLAAKMRTAQFGKKNPLTPPRPVVAANEQDLVLVMTGLSDWIEFFSGDTA